MPKYSFNHCLTTMFLRQPRMDAGSGKVTTVSPSHYEGEGEESWLCTTLLDATKLCTLIL